MQITGRLGNQLFQIATAYALARQSNQNFVMVYNGYNQYEQEYKSYFHELPWITRQNLPNSPNLNIYSEKHGGVNCFQYNSNLNLKVQELKSQALYLDGYFQNEKYFKCYTDNLKKMFLKKPVENVNGYFIHVRRGDYVNHPVYEIDYTSYLKKAIEHFPKDSQFYVVSDDITYCKTSEMFKQLTLALLTFVELDTIDTLNFMAACKGGICANSSFSWWGAYLGGREIVTFPKQWINNGMEVDIFFENSIVI